MATLWRQQTKLHPTFEPINRSLHEDWFLLPYELRLQRAHAAALAAAGLLTRSQHDDIARALDEIERGYAGAACPDSDAEDLHTWIEEALVERVGESGQRIHTARSRNDQVATLLKMYLIDAGGRLETFLRRLGEAACQRAQDWAALAMPLLTHQQFAAPATAGFWVLRYAAAWERVRSRLVRDVEDWRAHCPLGSGAVAGSSIPIDRQIQAEALGFEAPSPNALDATSTRDECLEYLARAAQLAVHLQAMATDVIVFSQTPLAWTVYPPEFSTGSSMMPNKRNPDAMELLRGECCELLAAHGQALTLLKGLPSGYNRDLQCIKPLVRRSAEKAEALCELAAAFLEKLAFDPAAMAASTSQGQIAATLKMEELVQAGAALRPAHHAVAEQAGRGEATLPGSAADWVMRYRTTGGAHPDETRRVARELLSRLAR